MGHENVKTTLQLHARKTDDPGAILNVLDDTDENDDPEHDAADAVVLR